MTLYHLAMLLISVLGIGVYIGLSVTRAKADADEPIDWEDGL